MAKSWERMVQVGDRLRGSIRPVVACSLTFKLLGVIVFTPISSGLLNLFLHRWGRCSVGNFELASFLFSPVGIAAVLVVGTVAVAEIYFELAGLLLLLSERRPSLRSTLALLAGHLRRLCVLALRQFVTYVLLAVPFLVVAGVVLVVLWSGRDLNGLIMLRPPVFWLGIGLSGAVLLAYGVLALRLFLRWLLALPALLSERDLTAKQAMRRSTELTRGRVGTLASTVIAWFLIQLVLAAAVTVPIRLSADFVLDRIGPSLSIVLPITGLFLIAHAIVATLLSILATATFAGLTLSYYCTLGDFSLPELDRESAAPTRRKTLPRRTFAAALFAALTSSVVASVFLLERTHLQDTIEITAHRGGAAIAPENTVAAIHKAIEARAEWAEIDVQSTADGALVIVHDTDLHRVGGVRRRVAEMSLAEIREVDVGSPFGPEFAGERIPTLDEVIAAAGDHIRLNIELKPQGADDVRSLVEAVLATARQAGILSRCRLCSQSYEGLLLAKRLAPELEIGYIAGAALGDLSKLEVDFLMVSVRLATRRLVDRAGTRGMAIHAWTVNDPDQLVRLVDRGVANVITDDPAAMRARLQEIRDLRPSARLLLRTRNLLAD